MAVILGIDAAWTPHGSSGIALLRSEHDRTEIVACTPSYESFVAYQPDRPVSWKKTPGTVADVPALLRTAERLAGSAVDLVAVDMPLSYDDILGRRIADNTVSSAFGAAGAGVHSPSKDRPGPIGSAMTEAFQEAGYALATQAGDLPRRALVEVFPLAALVRLMDRARRPAYKVGKIAKSWRKISPASRLDALLSEWSAIVAHLSDEIDALHFVVPPRSDGTSASSLKPYEDGLDAIICAWIGLCIVEGRAEPMGSSEAAIWIPTRGRGNVPFSSTPVSRNGI